MILHFSQVNKIAKLLIFIPFFVLSGWQNIAQATEDEEAYYKVINVPKNDVLNIRRRPDHRSPKVGRISRSEKCVMVIGTGYAPNGQKWYQVDYRKTIGWVNAHYLVWNPACY